ncbi:MAG: NGG1p interacting factor NIF3, partial [Candidatus Omnitrophota bacterium]
MKLSRFYELAVKFGKDCDVRAGNKFKSFEDSRILYGSPNTEVKKIIVGIDIEVADLLLADKLRQRQGLDLVLSHHPEGVAYASLYKVMRLQIDVLRKAGIKEAVARKLLEERMFEVERKIMPQNHTRPVDAAVLLDLPFMCLHTPADNHVYSYLIGLMNKEKPKMVEDIVEILLGIPEYKEAQKNLSGPFIITGSPRRRAGRILVD